MGGGGGEQWPEWSRTEGWSWIDFHTIGCTQCRTSTEELYTNTITKQNQKKPKNTKEKATNVVVLFAIKQDQMVMEEDVGNWSGGLKGAAQLLSRRNG